MAMTKTVTKYGRRRYYRRYRRYRNVSNVYFPCRVEGVFTIAFPNTPSGGQPIFAENGQLAIVSFVSLFQASQYYGSLTNMFGYYKVTGVLMEVTPGPNNFKGFDAAGLNVLLGFRFGKTNVITYKELVADNNSIVVGVNTIKRKYASAMGSNGWTPTSTMNSMGTFGVASSVDMSLQYAPTWTSRLAVYMVFKKSNI